MIDIFRIRDGKHVGQVKDWETANWVARIAGDNVKIASNLVWTGLVFLPQPRKNVILLDLTE